METPEVERETFMSTLETLTRLPSHATPWHLPVSQTGKQRSHGLCWPPSELESTARRPSWVPVFSEAVEGWGGE